MTEYRGQKHAVMVFDRGFTWPFCRRHMAQLREDYDEFVRRDAEVVVIGPEDKVTPVPAAFARYWEEEDLPFVGLPDPQHNVLRLYGQEVNLFKMGRRPEQCIGEQNVDGRAPAPTRRHLPLVMM